MNKKMTVEDLMNMEGNKIPTDVKSYSMLIHAPGKTGKTTLVHELYGEKVIMLASERRHSHLANVHVINIDNYGDYLRAMKLLTKDERIKEKYSAICIDTIGRLESYILDHVLSKLDIESLGDLAYGAAYAEFNKELEKALRLIEHSGFTPIFIAHSKKEVQKVLVDDASDIEKSSDTATLVKDKKDGKQYVEYEKTVPDIRKKFENMIARIVDNVLFLSSTVDRNGVESRKIFYRDTPSHTAGASFKGMPEYTELSAKAYKEAMEKAIQSEGSNNLEEGKREQSQGPQYDFNELMTELTALGKQLQEDGKGKERNTIIEKVLGHGKKAKDLDESQVEVLSVLVNELKEI